MKLDDIIKELFKEVGWYIHLSNPINYQCVSVFKDSSIFVPFPKWDKESQRARPANPNTWERYVYLYLPNSSSLVEVIMMSDGLTSGKAFVNLAYPDGLSRLYDVVSNWVNDGITTSLIGYNVSSLCVNI